MNELGLFFLTEVVMVVVTRCLIVDAHTTKRRIHSFILLLFITTVSLRYLFCGPDFLFFGPRSRQIFSPVPEGALTEVHLSGLDRLHVLLH